VTAQRGQVYRCDIEHGLKPWLVVSNNGRSERLDTVITATGRDLPTWVALTSADPLTGYAIADDIEQLYQDELGQDQGSLTRAIMARANHAIGLALALI